MAPRGNNRNSPGHPATAPGGSGSGGGADTGDHDGDERYGSDSGSRSRTSNDNSPGHPANAPGGSGGRSRTSNDNSPGHPANAPGGSGSSGGADTGGQTGDSEGNEQRGSHVAQAVSNALNSRGMSSTTLPDGTIVSRDSNGYVAVRDGDTMVGYRGDGSLFTVLVNNGEGYREAQSSRDATRARKAYEKGHVWTFDAGATTPTIDIDNFNTAFRDSQRRLSGIAKPLRESLNDIRGTIGSLEAMQQEWAHSAASRIVDHSGATTTVGQFLAGQIERRKQELAAGEGRLADHKAANAAFSDAYTVAAAPLDGDSRPVPQLVKDIDAAMANLRGLLATTTSQAHRDFLTAEVARLAGRRKELQSDASLSGYFAGLDLEDSGLVQTSPGVYQKPPAGTPPSTTILLTGSRGAGEGNFTGEFGSTKDFLGPALTPFQMHNYVAAEQRQEHLRRVEALKRNDVDAADVDPTPTTESYGGNWSPFLHADGKQVLTQAEATYRIVGTGGDAVIQATNPVRTPGRPSQHQFGKLHGKHPSEVLGRSDQNVAQEQWVDQNLEGRRIDRYGNVQYGDLTNDTWRNSATPLADITGAGDGGILTRAQDSQQFALHPSNVEIKGLKPDGTLDTGGASAGRWAERIGGVLPGFGTLYGVASAYDPASPGGSTWTRDEKLDIGKNVALDSLYVFGWPYGALNIVGKVGSLGALACW